MHIWLIRARLPATTVTGLSALLDDGERQRAEAMPAHHARRFVVAHGASRIIVGRCLGAPPAALCWQRGPHGKPTLTGRWTGVETNLSHSGDLAMLAMTGRRQVGVDVQEERPLDACRLATRFFSPAEARFVALGQEPAVQIARFTRLWTRKEAWVKGTGGRLVQGLSVPVDSTVPVDSPGEVMGDPSYRVRGIPAPVGFHAAVALAGAAEFRIVHRWWPPPR